MKSNKLSNIDIDKKLQDQQVKRLGEYKGMFNKILWLCLDCLHEFEATPNNLIHSKYKTSRCPICAQKTRQLKQNRTDIKVIDSCLKEKKIMRLGDFSGLNTKILVKCLVCFHNWSPKMDGILKRNYGCPKCATKERALNAVGGYNYENFNNKPEIKNYPAILYLIKITKNEEVFYKVGITKRSIKTRIRQYFKSSEYEVIYSKSTILFEAFVMEQLIKETFKMYQYFPRISFGGQTECFRNKIEFKEKVQEYFL